MEWFDFYSNLTVIGTIILSGILWYHWSIKRKENYWKSRGIPHITDVGWYDLYKTMSSDNFHLEVLGSYKKYGRIYGGLDVGSPSLIVGDVELLKDILVKDFPMFSYRRDIPTGDKILGNMVSGLKGEAWKRVRTVITPIFTTKRLKSMTNIINECAKSALDEFEKSLKKDGVNDMKSLSGAFTMDVIARAAFATKIDSLNDPDSIFMKHARSFFMSFNLKSFISLFLLPSWITSRVRFGIFGSTDFFKDVVLNAIKDRRRRGKRYNDLLQLLMDSLDEEIKENAKHEVPELGTVEDEADQYGSIINKETNLNIKYKKLSEDELLSQCVLFFSVGYETTATTITYMTYELALNPECQEKLIQEVDNAFQVHSEMNYDAIQDMKYLDCVVSETLRKYPALIQTARTAVEDYQLKGTGLTVEKGVIVRIPIYAMHHDPEYFEEPEKFKPERFVEINHPQFAYLPFGAGPRNCLGMRFALMEIKIFICNVLRHYRLHLAPTTKVPLQFKNSGGFLTVADLPLKVERRTPSNA